MTDGPQLTKTHWGTGKTEYTKLTGWLAEIHKDVTLEGGNCNLLTVRVRDVDKFYKYPDHFGIFIESVRK